MKTHGIQAAFKLALDKQIQVHIALDFNGTIGPNGHKLYFARKQDMRLFEETLNQLGHKVVEDPDDYAGLM